MCELKDVANEMTATLNTELVLDDPYQSGMTAEPFSSMTPITFVHSAYLCHRRSSHLMSIDPMSLG